MLGRTLHAGALHYTPLPESFEDSQQTELDEQLAQLPHLRKEYNMQAKIFLDGDHYMARRARALGFSAGQLVFPDRNTTVPEELRLWAKQNLEFLCLGLRVDKLEKLEKERKMQQGAGE